MAKKTTSNRKSFRLHDEASHPREEAAKQVMALGFFIFAAAVLAFVSMLK